jgi:hypothetical protein
VSEFCANDSTVAVRSCNFAPNHSDLAALSFFAGAVDVCDSLSEVESMNRMSALLKDLQLATPNGRVAVREVSLSLRTISLQTLPMFPKQSMTLSLEHVHCATRWSWLLLTLKPLS